MQEGTSLIIFNNSKFRLHKYSSEKELENVATKHSKEIFGENAVYLDSKKKISSKEGTGVIPDGLLLDFNRNKLYIVEVELGAHDIIGHISNQLTRFKLAMKNTTTREQIAKQFHEKIIQERLKAHTNLDDIQQIVNRQYGIIVLIDEISKQLSEVFEIHEQDGTEVLAIPFETYADSKDNYIYKFTTFTKEALEKEAKKWTFKWTTIPVEEHLDKTDKGIKAVFSALSKQICSLPGVAEKSRKNWVTYQTSPLKNFCTVKVLPNHLEINLKCNKSFKDEKGKTECIKRTPAWTFDRKLTIKSSDEIGYAMHLIEQAYGCICGK